MLTKPQQELLDAATGWKERMGEEFIVSGSRLRVARALQRKGYGKIRIGGSGVAYQGEWWHTFVPFDKPVKP